jgi:hypothetical protein
MQKSKDPQGKKWQLTFNNPADKGITHASIQKSLDNLPTHLYDCMADEIGLEDNTPHTHVYAVFSSALRFSTLKKLFPTAHLERVNASHKTNRDYVAKTGRWANDEKSDTHVQGTFKERGELPAEAQGGGIEAVIITRIQDGATNAEILLEFPHYLRGMRDVEYVRQSLKAQEYREKWRDLETVYIFGKTGVGKTRYVMDGCGYSNVYAVNNYKHPFDGYAGENVMLFDEFNSQFRIQDMNNYLDGYPLSLPARYSNKQACYEKVFIISNIDLRQQYTNEQQSRPEIWAAFLRRIHKVINFMPDGTRHEYDTQDYINGAGDWIELPQDTPSPFDN